MTFARGLLETIRLGIHRSDTILRASIVCAGLGFAAPLLPGLSRVDLLDAWRISGTAFTAGLFVTLVVPRLVTTWTDGLRAGRLGFFLARPVRTGTLWWGRLLEAVTTTIVSLLVSATPLCPWIARHFWEQKPPRPLALVGVAVIIAVFLTLAVIATLNAIAILAVRPGRWSALGFGLLSACVVLQWKYPWRAAEEFPFTSMDALIDTALVGACLLALMISSWRQLVAGRCDLHRAQRAFTFTLAFGLAVALVVPYMAIWWVKHPAPSALDPEQRLFGEPTPSGWFLAAGALNHRNEDVGVFLIHAPTADWIRIFSGSFHHYLDPLDHVSISPDGSVAVATDLNVPSGMPAEVTRFGLSIQRTRASLRTGGLSRLRPLAIVPPNTGIFISGNSLAVIDLRSGDQRCASKELPAGPRGLEDSLIGFDSQGTLLLLSDVPNGLAACNTLAPVEVAAVYLRFDPSTCKLDHETICEPRDRWTHFLDLDAATSRALSVGSEFKRENRILRLHDFRTGDVANLIEIGASPRTWVAYDSRAAFLGDDSIVAAWTRDERAFVAHLSTKGAVRGQWELPGSIVEPVASLEGGRVLLAVSQVDYGTAPLFDLNLVTGNLESFSGDYAIRLGMGHLRPRLPRSIVVEDIRTHTPTLISHNGALAPIRLRWLP